LIEIISKQLLLQLVGYLCYWQMGFNSVFKGLNVVAKLSALQKVRKFIGLPVTIFFSRTWCVNFYA